MDLDTPLQAYVNEKGENVYEFQIPLVPPIDSPIGGLQRNLASLLVADGGSLDPSMQLWFRVTPGPPISSAPGTAVVDSIMDSLPMDGRRAWTWLCKICGNFFPKKGALLTHVNVHLGFRPFQCRSCEKSFFHKSSLSSYIRNIIVSHPSWAHQQVYQTLLMRMIVMVKLLKHVSTSVSVYIIFICLVLSTLYVTIMFNFN